MGPITPEERQAIMARSPVKGKYDTAIDSESAYEMLQKRVTEVQAPAEAGGGGLLGQIGSIVGSIFGTTTGRGRLTTGQKIARDVTRTVTNRVAGQVAADIGKTVGGSLGAASDRRALQAARRSAEREVIKKMAGIASRPFSSICGLPHGVGETGVTGTDADVSSDDGELTAGASGSPPEAGDDEVAEEAAGC